MWDDLTTRGFRTALLAVACVLLGCSVYADTRGLASFESKAQMEGWQVSGDWELSDEHATDGEKSLRVRWPQGRGLIAQGFVADWSGWDALRLDCYNPGPPFTVALRADDADGNSADSTDHYLRTGSSTLEFILGGLARTVDVSRITAAHIRVDPVQKRPLQLYFDNFRLTRDEPPVVYEPPVVKADPVPEDAGNLLTNGDFEIGLQSWTILSDTGKGEYEFSTGTGADAHSGIAAAAMICITLGRKGIASRPVQVAEEDAYTLSFWVKGSLGGKIEYGLGSDDTRDMRAIAATSEWQQVTATFDCSEYDKARVFLYSLAPGTVFFDEARLVPGAASGEPGEHRPRPVPVDPSNLIANPDFEFGLHNWETWGEWDGGAYTFGNGHEADVYSGTYSASVICEKPGRGGIMARPIALEPDTYTLRFMAKSSEPSRIRYGAIYPGGQLLQDHEIGPQWEEFTLSITSQKAGDWRLYLMSTGGGTVYFDETSLKGTRRPADEADEAPVALSVPVRFTVRGKHICRDGEPFFALGVQGASPEQLRGTPFGIIPAWDPFGEVSLDDCSEAGVYVLPDLSGVMRGHLPQQVTLVAKPLLAHRAVMGWRLRAEPAGVDRNVPPDEMRLARRLLRDLAPGRITCSVTAADPQSKSYRYADAADVHMVYIDWTGDEPPADLSPIYLLTESVRTAVGPDKPIWVSLGAAGGVSTPEEHTAAAYVAIVEGADGLFFHGYSAAARRPEIWSHLCKLGAELKSISGILTSDDAPMQPIVMGPAVRTLVKATAEGLCLVAVNAEGMSEPDCMLTLPGVPDGEARVLFEDRTVKVSGGKLVDDFAPFARHVYMLPGK